jgi:hypothetical protein
VIDRLPETAGRLPIAPSPAPVAGGAFPASADVAKLVDARDLKALHFQYKTSNILENQPYFAILTS